MAYEGGCGDSLAYETEGALITYARGGGGSAHMT